jgi:hypothetical protein
MLFKSNFLRISLFARFRIFCSVYVYVSLYNLYYCINLFWELYWVGFNCISCFRCYLDCIVFESICNCAYVISFICKCAFFFIWVCLLSCLSLIRRIKLLFVLFCIRCFQLSWWQLSFINLLVSFRRSCISWEVNFLMSLFYALLDAMNCTVSYLIISIVVGFR